MFKTTLWSIYIKADLSICLLVCYQPIHIIWAPAVDDGCRFGHHFLMAGEQFVENTSSSRIKLIMRLFYPFILNQDKALLPNPFQRGLPASY